ncbi:hypothetical protein [Halioxenophilus aromaticivorans]|uniref:Mobilization protein n=1 Tax=Halioxenophilus aromaticivorans TaxID=1306992 RepID=A0AAV3U3V0_9ALTE
MARIHFISGEKGGVGKSFTSRVLAQYFIDQKKPFANYDSDQSHATLSRFYADYTKAVKVDDLESLDEILKQAEEKPELEIIVDLAAQTAKHLDVWIEESDLFEFLTEIDATVYFWHVMDDGADSARLLDKYLRRYGDSPMQLIVVKNQGRGQDFSFFDNSEIAKKAKAAGAVFVTLPKLVAGLTQKIDFYNFSFWAATNNTKAMSAIERQRAKKWLQDSYREIDLAFK